MKEKNNAHGDILLLEAFYGGSHRDVADGLAAHSRWSYDLYTLPDTHWKRRLRGAALELAAGIPDPSGYRMVLSGGMMSLADLRGVWGSSLPPLVLYAHETQLNYPSAPQSSPQDEFYHYDITNMLTADLVVFNSCSHRDRFFSHAADFLERLAGTAQALEPVRNSCCVVYPGCWFPADLSPPNPREPGPLRIVWNHRWEYDKQPQEFLAALKAAADRGAEFELILLGEPPWRDADAAACGRHTRESRELHDRFGSVFRHAGYLASREEYYAMLSRGDVIISTAIQENFGISVVEAMYHGCLPLLPNRLSYPELLPREMQRDGLYSSFAGLVDGIVACALAVQDPQQSAALEAQRAQLRRAMAGYSWEQQARDFDRCWEERVFR